MTTEKELRAMLKEFGEKYFSTEKVEDCQKKEENN